jgi:Fe2+ or Zn2+ uptake regulation protein
MVAKGAGERGLVDSDHDEPPVVQLTIALERARFDEIGCVVARHSQLRLSPGQGQHYAGFPEEDTVVLLEARHVFPQDCHAQDLEHGSSVCDPESELAFTCRCHQRLLVIYCVVAIVLYNWNVDELSNLTNDTQLQYTLKINKAPDMTSKDICQRLVDAGYKLTLPRKLIADWLATHSGMFSASEILERLATIDKVTVYRTLDLLCSLDIIHATASLHGEQHYEVHGKQNHHHHVVCEGCEKNQCVPCDIPNKKFSSFRRIHHNLVFTGVCTTCAL